MIKILLHGVFQKKKKSDPSPDLSPSRPYALLGLRSGLGSKAMCNNLYIYLRNKKKRNKHFESL